MSHDSPVNSTQSGLNGVHSEVDDKEKIRKLEAQVNQLRNIIAKLTGQRDSDDKKSKKTGRNFNFLLYKKRRVLLHVAYIGWDLCGFAVQEITGKTVESELFQALTTTRLIESRETSNYHRCGRTDRGVSAFRQIISIDLRSNLLQGLGVYDYEGCLAEQRVKDSKDNGHLIEIDYCKLLNARLPPQIQVIGWAPCLQKDYSARFDCKRRTYKYFFPKGDMDLDQMRDAGQRLVGCHDFRNFCKMDVANGVVNYIRSISQVTIDFVDPSLRTSEDPYQMCVATIVGKAYLWHQIRCIIAVLLRVGSGLEKPEVVDELLDVERHPRRPQYIIASEIPLNLFDAQYEEVDEDGNPRIGDWNYDIASLQQVMKEFQAQWTEHSCKTAMLRASLTEIEKLIQLSGGEVPNKQPQTLASFGNVKKSYTPLMKMLTCPTLEEKLESSAGKRRKINETTTTTLAQNDDDGMD